MSPPRRGVVGMASVAQRRWLLPCALLMALLLPLQGIALSLDAALRPAHVHRDVEDGGGAMLESVGAVERVGDRGRRAAAATALADDTVLEVLPAHRHGHARGADGRDVVGTRLLAGAPSGDVSRAAVHQDVGHHAHAPDDPGVVLVADDRLAIDGGAAGLGKIASDGMVMLPPTWPQALPECRLGTALAAPLPAYATRHDVPPDRPPA